MADTHADFEELFRAEMTSVVATVCRITDDVGVAEEIAQDAFAKALLRWRRLRSYDRPGAWVRRVAIRDAVRAAGCAQRQQPLPGDPPWAAADRTGADDMVLGAVRALPVRQRTVVVLYYLEDRPTAEVAELMDCREATVRSLLRHARERLADVLADPYEEEVVDDARR